MKTTIESKHKDKISSFLDKSNTIAVKNEIEQLNQLKKQSNNITEKLNLELQINNKNEQLNDTNEEINYLLNVVPIINKYNETNNECVQQSLNNFVVSTKGKEKGSLYNDFLDVVENVSNSKIKKINIYMCGNCNVPKLLSHIESTMICPQCGITDVYFDTGINNLSYEQEINSEGNIHFSYKRINHFNEWLAQFQAKESTEIPTQIVDNLRNEFHKNKVKSINEITKTKVKQYLKLLKYNKYYEHSTHITNILTGVKPPSISPELEEKFRTMFRNIQEPFEKNKPKERLNFLSYSYCLYKFCELLNLDYLLCNFPLLKSREKLHQQDVIWKKICQDLNWEYISTV